METVANIEMVHENSLQIDGISKGWAKFCQICSDSLSYLKFWINDHTPRVLWHSYLFDRRAKKGIYNPKFVEMIKKSMEEPPAGILRTDEDIKNFLGVR
ncbi:hypothetical protein FACS1894199_05730 [Bacteroidia bacterium]|nr:hypothetical protein FACS1894199_05730 [Bacteroidia bacterium]